jgi:apolipoprotein N-acyltransferase
VVGGAIIPFSMAPYHFWPLALLGLILIASSLKNTTPKQAMLLAFAAGVGLFGAGVNWVFVAITQFGSSSIVLAALLTALFVVGLAIVFAVPFAIYGRCLSRTLIGQTLGFSALWVLGEWIRSWLFTGFPWLYSGYGFINTPLTGYAPITGIFGVSFVACLSASLVLVACTVWQHHLNQPHQKQQNAYLVQRFGAMILSAGALWGVGALLQQVEWTTPKPHNITIGLVQPNIPQERKWDPAYYQSSLDTLTELSRPLWHLNWVIWPEAAVPYPYHQAETILKDIDRHAKKSGAVFISGIIFDDYSSLPDDAQFYRFEDMKFYNAIIARGFGSGEYFKQRLVPFGEYVPFEKQLRGLIAFFNLPTSIINIGPFNPDGLNANGVTVAAAICYEIVYPDLIAELSTHKDVILTISNDAWFGHSNGPLQHFDMARMRAIETGRYVVRSTNNGLSGFIKPNGQVANTGHRFTRETITGSVQRMSGLTPFMVWKSWPMVALTLLIIICCAAIQKRY